MEFWLDIPNFQKIDDTSEEVSVQERQNISEKHSTSSFTYSKNNFEGDTNNLKITRFLV